jgi:hypothetical protein
MAHEVLLQVEAELGHEVNPLEALIRTGADTTQPMSLRVTCWGEALPYLFPKLQSQALAVTRDDDAQDMTAIDLTAVIMADPAMVEAAQTISLGLSAAGSDRTPEPARICAPDDGRAEQERAGR